MLRFGLAAVFALAVSATSPTVSSQSGALATLASSFACTATSCGWTYKTCWYNNPTYGGSNCTNDPCLGPGWFGVICKTVGSNQVITVIFLGFNSITGGFSGPAMAALPDLTDLMVQNNQIQGAFPSEIGSATKLVNIYLFRNNIGGALPTQLGLLTLLEKFDFSYNNFVGGIPSTLANMAYLTQLTGSYNRLTAQLPSELSTNPVLKLVYLDNNQLTGTLPVEWATGVTRSSLQFVQLNNNMLSGPIPESWAGFQSPATLTLNSNNFGCFVPDFIVAGGFYLNVSDNNFLCPIPPSLVGQPDAPSCNPFIVGNVTPAIVYTDYAGDFQIDGSGFQINCDLVVYWISARGVILTSELLPTSTTTQFLFKKPTNIGGAQQYTIELRQRTSLKRVGGVVWKITINARCPGANDPITYPSKSGAAGCAINGTCLSNGVCSCDRDWQGDKCHLSCSTGNIPGFVCDRGTCFFAGGVTPVCSCDPGWVGDGCNIRLCNPDCLNGGVCDIPDNALVGKCVCPVGFSGTQCETEAACPECVSPLVCQRFSNPEKTLRYAQPICECPDAANGQVPTVDGDCISAEEASEREKPTPAWVWVIVAIAIAIVIGVVIFVIIKCRFKKPEGGGEMQQM